MARKYMALVAGLAVVLSGCGRDDIFWLPTSPGPANAANTTGETESGSNSWSVSGTESDSTSTSESDSISTSISTSESDSISTSESDSISTSESDSISTSESDSTSTSESDSTSTSESDSTSTSESDSTSTSESGSPSDCEFDFDCQPEDPCEVGRCVAGTCLFSPLDLDGDGFTPLQCGGGDCNDLNPATFPGAFEACDDNDDNDCNGVTDCFDPACDGATNCGCQPAPGGEVCDNGEDDDCDTIVDCLDADCSGTPICGCLASEVGACGNGFDEDCDGLFDCDDGDCDTDPQCQCLSTPEDCFGGEDEDCDLLVDCADSDCAAAPACECFGPPSPENCSDGTDNDCDGVADCADPDCFISPACDECEEEICNDGQDNDCDNLIDCGDPACAFSPFCEPSPEQCNNQIDDDNDGAADCNDIDCASAPICLEEHANCNTALLVSGSGMFFGNTDGFENNTSGSCGGAAGEVVFSFVLSAPSQVTVTAVGTSFDSTVYLRAGDCENGNELGCDDDSGGNLAGALTFPILYPGTYFAFLDGYAFDPFGGANDGPYQFNLEIIPNPPEICDDGLDNDGDVYVDCGDPDCTFDPSCAGCNAGANPTAEFGVVACTDGLDNDCDGVSDCSDEDCSASDFYVTECCNGSDQNNNGIADDFNCRCNNDSECISGQICYDHTAYACGIPCTFFFGDVCPFVAAGSFCNETTNQCEY